jgi:hypothetical protein
MPPQHRQLAVMAAMSALALLALPGCSSGGTTSAPANAPKLAAKMTPVIRLRPGACSHHGTI